MQPVDDNHGPIDDRATLLRMRIQLKPGLPLLSRGPSTVQIGVEPRHGTLVDGLTPADHELLAELATGVDDSRLALPPDAGSTPVAGIDRILRARMLVSLLSDTGVLQRSTSGRAALVRLAGSRPRLTPDAAAWSIVHPAVGDGWELLARRRAATVELRGSGRTALMLAGTLAAAGVGTVRLLTDDAVTAADVGPGGALPTDVGGRTRQVAARIVARATGRSAEPSEVTSEPASDPTPATEPEPGPPADLVVLVERAAADPTLGDRLLAADLPHLSVVVRETSVVVGPLVVPGRSACLRCLDLHRTERDPQWPLVLAQLRQPDAPRLPREETALAQVAAGVAALQVLGHLDGHGTPTAIGAPLEVELPDGLTCRRPWPAHPSCGCCWPPSPATPTASSGGTSVGASGGASGTTRESSPAQDGRGGPPAMTMLR